MGSDWALSPASLGPSSMRRGRKVIALFRVLKGPMTPAWPGTCLAGAPKGRIDLTLSWGENPLLCLGGDSPGLRSRTQPGEAMCGDLGAGTRSALPSGKTVPAADSRVGPPLLDINECITGSHNCRLGETCINTVGSFRCQRDSSCGTGYELTEHNDCKGTARSASKTLIAAVDGGWEQRPGCRAAAPPVAAWAVRKGLRPLPER